MVKKILSSIILIMIIYSSSIYATNVVVPEDTTNPSEGQETVVPEDTTTNQDSENKSPETEDTNNGSNVNDGINPDIDNSNGNQEDINTGNNENEGNTNIENNQPGSTVEPPKDAVQEPINNNQQSINNNIIPKSSEARLKDLKVDLEGLTPEFNKNTTEYYLVVDLSVNKINVKASLVDSKAKWAIYGNKNLKEGENTITINVTAEDGTEKKYYIYVTKVDDVELANAELEKIEIEGFNLYPTFKSNIYSYNLDINQDISNLNITAVPLNEKAKVEIEGNENLQEGENIIKINVTAANEETVRTYKINTYISSDRVELQEENKVPAIILIVILGTCIIALGAFIVIKNRKYN